MKFIITAETTDSYAQVSNISIPLWQEYSDRHGYEFSVRNVIESERGPVWERVPHMQEKLKECDWVVHVDLDAIPTNFLIPLTEFVFDKNIIITECVCEDGVRRLNDGFSMFRNTKITELILWNAWTMHNPDFKIFCAQDAFEIQRKGSYSVHFETIPGKMANSFLWKEYGHSESTPGNWTKGDFILHLPGMNTEKRVELLTRYKEEIIR